MSEYKPQFKPAEKPVEEFRLLDENGELRKGAEAPMSDELALEGLRFMTLARVFDE